MNDNYIEMMKELATRTHDGVYRENKKDLYITHPAAVAERCKYPISKCIAWGHDVIEDSEDPYISAEFIQENFPSMIYDGVNSLTRDSEEDYYSYIIRISKCAPVVIAVKIADLDHNLSDSEEGNRKQKYLLARHILMSKLTSEQFIRLLNPLEEQKNGKEIH